MMREVGEMFDEGCCEFSDDEEVSLGRKNDPVEDEINDLIDSYVSKRSTC